MGGTSSIKDEVFETSNPVEKYKFKWRIQNFSLLEHNKEVATLKIGSLLGASWRVTIEKRSEKRSFFGEREEFTVLRVYSSLTKDFRLELFIKVKNVQDRVVFYYRTTTSRSLKSNVYEFPFKKEGVSYTRYSLSDFPEDVLVLDCQLTISNFKISTRRQRQFPSKLKGLCGPGDSDDEDRINGGMIHPVDIKPDSWIKKEHIVGILFALITRIIDYVLKKF